MRRRVRYRGITHLVIGGLQSEYCVKETILGALARGYEVTLVADGHSTYDGKDYLAAQKTAEVNTSFGGRINVLAASAIRFT